MHEGKKEIEQYNFSDKEFELLKKILKTVENAQDNLSIEKKILPYSSLVTSWVLLGIIKNFLLIKTILKFLRLVLEVVIRSHTSSRGTSIFLYR